MRIEKFSFLGQQSNLLRKLFPGFGLRYTMGNDGRDCNLHFNKENLLINYKRFFQVELLSSENFPCKYTSLNLPLKVPTKLSSKFGILKWLLNSYGN